MEGELGEWPGSGSYKGKAVSVGNIAGDVEGGCKSGSEQPHNKKAAKIYLVKVLRIEEEVGDAEVFTETTRDHRKQNDPAQQQDLVASEVIKEQLYRKRVKERFPEFNESRHSYGSD